MSDNIPFDMQVEIIKSFPAKSLLRFRSVSKTWKSLIDSADFIVNYTGKHSLVTYKHTHDDDIDDLEHKFVSIADDHTFPQNKVSLTLPIMLKSPNSIIGSSRGMLCSSSHGLLCLYNEDKVEDSDGLISIRGRVVLWNPSIRKAIGIAVDVTVPHWADRSVVGFGVCRETSEPKLVKIPHMYSWDDMERNSDEVFTLTTGAWRSSYTNLTNLTRDSVQFYSDQLGVDVDGVLYWLATYSVTRRRYNIIVSFDITSEVFREVELPDCLGYHTLSQLLCLSKLMDSLVVLVKDVGAFVKDINATDGIISVVWMMNDGSFTKLYNFQVRTPIDLVRGFRKSGEYIIELYADDLHKLVVFEPNLKHIDDIGISDRKSCSFSVYPYVETLLLHDQPNLKMFCLGN